MKVIRDYKGVAFIYLLITIISIFWFTDFDNKAVKNKKVDNTKTIVMTENLG